MINVKDGKVEIKDDKDETFTEVVRVVSAYCEGFSYALCQEPTALLYAVIAATAEETDIIDLKGLAKSLKRKTKEEKADED